ncbi:MAG: hypothetical protein ACOC2W_03630 [bacterium]
MKTKYKVPLPRLGKLEFGNLEQISAIKKYQALNESKYYNVKVFINGHTTLKVKADCEREICDNIDIQIVKDDMDIESIEIDILSKSLPPKKIKNNNNLKLF